MTRRTEMLLASALLAGASVILAGCASSSSAPPAALTPTPAAPASTASAPGVSPAPSGVALAVVVADGKVTPAAANVAVPVGSPVHLTVTSDVADQVHVHGYDIEQAVQAGGTVTFDFTADQAGTFEVETHESGLLLLKLVVS